VTRGADNFSDSGDEFSTNGKSRNIHGDRLAPKARFLLLRSSCANVDHISSMASHKVPTLLLSLASVVSDGIT
jgi:hypothetical protein